MKSGISTKAFGVRVMTWNDCEPVRQLCAELGYPSMQVAFQARFEDLRANFYHEAFVACTSAGRVVGWLHVYEVPALLCEPTIELGGLVVAANFRQQGVGTALLDVAAAWGEARGRESMLLATRLDRAGAKKFYAKRGFRPDYDATYLRRSIAAPRALADAGCL